MRALAMLALAVAAIPVRAEDKIDTSMVEERARAVGKALLEEDYAKVADLTYPKIVEVIGGRDKMIEQTKALMGAMRRKGFEFKKYSVGKPEQPVVDGKTAYVIVPTTLEITGPKVKLETEGYLLAITTDRGKSWTFADGAGMDNPQIKDKVFPSLPAGLKLPAKKPPKVTKE